jgi:hypothetical protein
MAHLSTLFSVVLCKKYNEKLYLKSKKMSAIAVVLKGCMIIFL